MAKDKLVTYTHSPTGLRRLQKLYNLEIYDGMRLGSYLSGDEDNYGIAIENGEFVSGEADYDELQKDCYVLGIRYECEDDGVYIYFETEDADD